MQLPVDDYDCRCIYIYVCLNIYIYQNSVSVTMIYKKRCFDSEEPKRK